MISVTILAKNSEETLGKTLDSLKSFSEVILLDTGSTDSTLEIARSYPNVVIHEHPLEGFGPSHNRASSLSSNDWILSIDSDEILSPELIQEIQSLSPSPNSVYSILRHNFLNGKHIKCCGGWHPDWVLRLYDRTSTRFSDAPVHEKIQTPSHSIIRLSSPLLHTPYRSTRDFLAKMHHYASLHPNNSPSLLKAITHSTYAFIKSYIFKRGFLGGREGFIISAYNSQTTFWKYL